MASRSSPVFQQTTAERARTWRILIAVAVSVLAHTLVMSGGGVGSSGKRAEQLPYTQLHAVLTSMPSTVIGEDAAEAQLAKPSRIFRPDIEPPARERATDTGPTSRQARRPSPRAQQTARKHAPASQGPGTANAAASASDAAMRSPDTTYYSIRQLDIYPALMMRLALENLTKTLAADVRARALVELHISEMGVVDSATVLEAHPGGVLDAELTAVFLAARFTPAVRHGRAVRSRVLVRVE